MSADLVHPSQCLQLTLNSICSRKIYKYNYYDDVEPKRPTNEIISTAYDRIGETEYSLECNNCQQFCFMCRNGIAKSPEVKFSFFFCCFKIRIFLIFTFVMCYFEKLGNKCYYLNIKIAGFLKNLTLKIILFV
jgi:hypothetical protein